MGKGLGEIGGEIVLEAGDGEVDEGADAGGEAAAGGVNDVDRERGQGPLGAEAEEASVAEVVADEPFRGLSDTETAENGFPDAGGAFDGKDGFNGKRLEGAGGTTGGDHIGGAELGAEEAEPGPGGEVRELADGRMGGDEFGSGDDVTGDLAGGSGDKIFIGDGADDGAGFVAIFNHAQGQVGVAELGGDAGVAGEEIGDKAGDEELADVDGGEEAKVAGEGGMFTVEALLGIVGKGE